MSEVVTPQSGGVRLTAYEMQVLIGTSMSGCVMRPDTTFNVQNAWKRLRDLGLIDRADGLAIATTTGRERIRSTLADPIPEAPADEEVEDVAVDCVRELRKHLRDSPVANIWLDTIVAALRRSTATDKPGVREAALEEAAKVAETITQDGDYDLEPEATVAASVAGKQIAATIRALSASPLTREDAPNV